MTAIFTPLVKTVRKRPTKMTFWQTRPAVALSALTLAISLVSATGCQQPKNQLAELPPAEVTVTHPIEQSITDFLEENGTTEASEDAEVRSRVRGFIEEITFEPGQAVQAGDVLYRIEKDQYEAEMNSAEATLAAAEAAIKVAESQVKTAEAELDRVSRELKRQQELIKTRATSQAEYDTVAAAYASAKANISSTRASVDAAVAEKGRVAAELAQAKLNFDYTIVRAPIAGSITKTDVKKGNLVENGTVLATIIDDKRVFVNFNLSDREVLNYRKNQKAKLSPGEEWKRPELSTFPVYLHRESDEGFPFTGHLQYADEQGVDSKTGTLALRAVFDNPSEDLFPGLFVRIRLPLEKNSALLIPELAVGKDQRGNYALTVDQKNKVERKSIVTATKYKGWIVVESGLKASDLVIFEGLQRARPGSTVKPQEKQLTISDDSLLRGLADEPTIETPPPASGTSSADEPPAN